MHHQEKLFFTAAKNGDTKTIQRLIKAGVNVNATTPNKWTALMLAALYGHSETLRCLLHKKANIHCTQKNSATDAFFLAVRSGNSIKCAAIVGQGGDRC